MIYDACEPISYLLPEIHKESVGMVTWGKIDFLSFHIS